MENQRNGCLPNMIQANNKYDPLSGAINEDSALMVCSYRGIYMISYSN